MHPSTNSRRSASAQQSTFPGQQGERAMLRFEIPAQKTLTHDMVIPIRWADMDAMGHVNNASYFRYFEIVRVAWFDAAGFPLNRHGEGPGLINAFCNFYQQLEYPGNLLARHYICNPGRSSLDTYVTLERTDTPGKIYAAGGGKFVWVDFPKQKSAPLPKRLRDLALGQ
jgi:acyl-CoA thioester hydrolase